MSGYLLDTGVALLAVSRPELLSRAVKEAIERGPAYLSVIAYWEVMIKSRKGMLDVGDSRLWFRGTLDALAARPLLYRPEHVSALYDLPTFHQDPFDRALIAQATVENLTLLTTDGTIPLYASEHFHFIG